MPATEEEVLVNSDHIISIAEGSDPFAALPTRIQQLGPCTGSKEGKVKELRLPCRVILAEQGFVTVHASSAADAMQIAEEVEPEAVKVLPSLRASKYVQKWIEQRDAEQAKA